MINNDIISKRKSFKDLNYLASYLYEKVYETEKIGDLNELIHTYSKARIEFFENLKKNGIAGILHGSKSFLETLIEA